MLGMPKRRVAILLLGMSLWGVAVSKAAASAGGGSWIVLKDGTRMQAQGEVERRGNRLVFVGNQGWLVSLPAAEVDFVASREIEIEAKGEARTSAAVGIAAARSRSSDEPAFVLTDADVGHVPQEQGPGEETGQEAVQQRADDEAARTGVARAGRLVVTKWGKSEEAPGKLRVFGYIKNRSEDAAVAINVVVHVFDDAGAETGTATAVLDKVTLLPAEETFFQASLEDVFVVRHVDFSVESAGLKASRDVLLSDAR